jgi:hypothetical protein
MTSLGATLYGNTDTQDSLLVNTSTKSTGLHYTLYSMRFWDVRMPPVKKHMVHGYMVPTMKGAVSVSRVFSKPRRISVEVYRPSETHTISTDASTVQTQLFNQLLKGISTNDIIAQDQKLQNDDICVLRVLKPKPTLANADGGDDQEENMLEQEDWGKSRTKTFTKEESKNECNACLVLVWFQDCIVGWCISPFYIQFFFIIGNRSIGSASMSSLGFGGMEEESSVGMASWRERLRYKLENIEIVKASAKTCDIKLGVGSETNIRSLHFSKPRHCQSFIKVMEKMKVMERERAKHKAEEYFNNMTSSRRAASSPSSTTTPTRKSPLNVKKRLYSMFDGGNNDHDTASTTATMSKALFKSNSNEQQSSGGRDTPLAIDLLIEIVSASNLPAADIYTSDPYVVVREASKEVHRTKIISNT